MLRGHTAVQAKHAVPQAVWERKRGENCLENTFITNFQNATFKVQREGAAMFALTASKVLLRQEGRWVGHGFPRNFPFPWAAKVRGRRSDGSGAAYRPAVYPPLVFKPRSPAGGLMEAGCGVDAVDFHKTLATAPAHRCIPKFAVCVTGPCFSPLVVFNAHSKVFAPNTWGPRSGCHFCLCR